MAANTLAIPYSVLQDEVQATLGWRKASGSWSSTQTADFGRSVKSGQILSYYPPVLPGDKANGNFSPHIWSFLTSQTTTLTLRAPYSTGTVSVTLGVVTLSGGTFPSWSAAGDMWISGVRYSVNTRDSNTQVTLNDLTLTGVSAATYELIQHYYELPSDFGSLVGDGFTYPRSSTQGAARLRKVPERTVRELDRDFQAASWPCEYSLSYIAPTSTNDARQQAQFFPVTSADRTLEYRYEVIPVALDGSTYVYHHGPPWFGELLKKAVVYEALAKIKGRDTSAAQAAHECFMEALESAVGMDRRTSAVATLGTPPSDDLLAEELLYEIRHDIPMSMVNVDV